MVWSSPNWKVSPSSSTQDIPVKHFHCSYPFCTVCIFSKKKSYNIIRIELRMTTFSFTNIQDIPADEYRGPTTACTVGFEQHVLPSEFHFPPCQKVNTSYLDQQVVSDVLHAVHYAYLPISGPGHQVL